MGGFGGLSLAQYDETPDWWILHSHLAPFEGEKPRLVPLRKRIVFDEVVEEEAVGPEEAREAPTFESLQIPEECLSLPPDVRMPNTGWILTFWQVWRSRGKPTEWIRDEYWRVTVEEPRERARKWEERERERVQQRGRHG